MDQWTYDTPADAYDWADKLIADGHVNVIVTGTVVFCATWQESARA